MLLRSKAKKSKLTIKMLVSLFVVFSLMLPTNLTPAAFAADTVLLNETFDNYTPGAPLVLGSGNTWGTRGTAPTMNIVKDPDSGRTYGSITHTSGSAYIGQGFENQTGGFILEFDINIPNAVGGFLFINKGSINSTTSSASQLEFSNGNLQKRKAKTPYATYDTTHWYHYTMFFSVTSKTINLTITDLTTNQTVATATETFTVDGVSSFGFAPNPGATMNIDNIRITKLGVQMDGLTVDGGYLTDGFEYYWKDYSILVPSSTQILQFKPTSTNADTLFSVAGGTPVSSNVAVPVDVSNTSVTSIPITVTSSKYPGVEQTYTFSLNRLSAHMNPENVETNATDSKVELGWTEPKDPDFEKVNIYQVNPSNSSLTLLDSVLKGRQMATFTGLSNGTTYTYVVKAVYENGIESSGVTVSAIPVNHQARQMEYLTRGLIAMKKDNGVYVGWRLLGTDPEETTFNLYRDGVLVNTLPIADSTNFLDAGGDLNSTYTVRAVLNGQEQDDSESVKVMSTDYISIPIQQPDSGVTVTGEVYTYRSNESSVADLDGDGEYEIIVKWSPTNQKDNGQAGHTGPTFYDAYELDGTLLWRINTGVNIRSGSHYNQFLAYDLDGDGKAEVAMKTADGTVDGVGDVIGDATKNYVNSDGFILDGPEYLTVFRGTDGKALDTTEFIPGRGNVADWGDSYGNRVDRFLGAIAYLDGVHPSLVMTRGYYTRMALTAYDFKNGKIVKRWAFDSTNPGSEEYYGSGNHQLSVADVDGDGKDEIITGAAAIDDDGTGLWNSGLGHGDAMHVGDLDPNNPGLEVWAPQEDGRNVRYSLDLKDAKTGRVIFGQLSTGTDTGRALAGDIDPRYPGEEVWGPDGAYPNVWEANKGRLYSVTGELISTSIPSTSFAIWWDGDLSRELLDHNFDAGGIAHVDKWDYMNLKQNQIKYFDGFVSTGTKGYPFIQADLFGDWREEVMLKDINATSELRIYSTTELTQTRLYTLMHDPVYRNGVAWQNVAYNQPPHPSFYLGNGMETPPKPNIYTVKATTPGDPSTPSYSLTGPSSVQTGETFQLTYGLSNLTDSVFAKSVTVNYDPSLLEYVDVNSLVNGFSIVGSTNGPGTVKILEASTGTPVTGSLDLLSITFKAKNSAAATNINMSGIVLGDQFGNEVTVNNGSDHLINIVAPAPVDKSGLSTIIAEATSAVSNAKVLNPSAPRFGYYPQSAINSINSAITAASSVFSQDSATQEEVDQAKNTLIKALAAFRASANQTAGVGDLALIAVNYNATSASSNWKSLEMYDSNNDGKLDLIDLVAMAQRILN